jgi:hypothetical protein
MTIRAQKSSHAMMQTILEATAPDNSGIEYGNPYSKRVPVTNFKCSNP